MSKTLAVTLTLEDWQTVLRALGYCIERAEQAGKSLPIDGLCRYECRIQWSRIRGKIVDAIGDENATADRNSLPHQG
jgi:hypothetical protein